RHERGDRPAAKGHALRHFGDHTDLGVAAPPPRDEEHAGVAGRVGRQGHGHAREDHDVVEWDEPEVCHTWNVRPMLYVVNYPVVNYTVLDEAGDALQRGLAPPGQAVLRPAGEPSPAGRRAPALPRPVSRAAPDRAGPAHAHGPPRRDTRLPRVERHGAGGSARVPRSRAPARVGRGPAGGGPGAHPHRPPAPRAAPRTPYRPPPPPP